MNKDAAANIIRSLGIDTSAPFFLHVGKDSWYKNRIGALRIFYNFIVRPERPDYNFVFAGASMSNQMVKYIYSKGLQDRVFAVTDLTQEALQALYSSAAALIFPSLAEGFGWPIIEAQACGCPVFTSNRPPMTEAGGVAAIYLDPENPEEASQTIAYNLKNADQIRQAGSENVKRFSTGSMIASYIGIYNDILGQRQDS